jgi:hypothetical protein
MRPANPCAARSRISTQMVAFLIASSLRLAPAHFPYQAGSAHVIQRTLKAGDTDRYTFKMSMAQNITMGGSAVQAVTTNMEAEYRLKVLSIVNHHARAEMTINTTKSDMGGMMGTRSMNIPKQVKELGTLDARNRFVLTDVDNSTPSSFMNLGSAGAGAQASGVLVELPDHPVKIGDSWNMELAGMDKAGMNDRTLKITLVGPGEVNGHSVWKVKVTGRVPVAMDIGKMLGAGGSSQTGPGAAMLKGMKMTGTMVYEGRGAIDRQTGKTVSLVYTVDSAMTMNMAGGQSGMGAMNMKVAGKTETSMFLKGY